MYILQVRAVVGYIYIYIYCRRIHAYLASSGCYGIYILQANSCISCKFGLLWDIYIAGELMYILQVRAVVGYIYIHIYCRRIHALPRTVSSTFSALLRSSGGPRAPSSTVPVLGRGPEGFPASAQGGLDGGVLQAQDHGGAGFARASVLGKEPAGGGN